MILYHYTAREYLPAILAEGLTKGEVPLTQTNLRNAVWLTSDRAASGHGLTDGRDLTLAEKEAMGVPLTSPARFPDKRAIRITVRVPQGDRQLVRWRNWAGGRVEPKWQATLEAIAGGPAKAKTWFLYMGVIPPTWFTEVWDLRADAPAATRGSPAPLDPAAT